MSDTQEKQLQPCEAEHTPFKMVSKSNGTSSYYECMHCGYVDFSEAIESAKRETEIDTLEACSMKLDQLHQGTPGAGWIHYGEYGEWLDESIAELKQSEESE